MKTCRGCNVEKPPAEFTIERLGKDGLRANCRVCENARLAVYRKANRGKLAARRAKYYAAHREREIAWGAKYRVANPERVAAGYAKYRKANRESLAAKSAKHHEAYPQRANAREARRRAIFFNVKSHCSAAERMEVLAGAMGLCSYCGQPSKLVLDHIEPLSRGGTDDADNLAAACGPCNSSKGNVSLLVWLFSRDAPRRKQRALLRRPDIPRLPGPLASTVAKVTEGVA